MVHERVKLRGQQSEQDEVAKMLRRKGSVMWGEKKRKKIIITKVEHGERDGDRA